jgi:hypothetical protein
MKEKDIKQSTDIINMSHNLFKGAKPLEGKALEVLNKTFKRVFSKTPTRL